MSRAVVPAQVARLRAAVARHVGLAFDDGKAAFLADVLQRNVPAAQTVDGYLAELEGPGSRAMRALVPALTVGETYFFRNAEQLRVLAAVALPARLRARAAGRTLRILSAGCSTGEEAFSIGIVIHDLLDPSWDVSVLGVDVNPSALKGAGRGRYAPWALRETPPEVQARWFRQDGNEWVLADAARTRVRFEERNVVSDDLLWSPGAYDIVFCRNLLMYLTPEGLRRVVAHFERALAPGGYLFLGHAEALRGLSDELRLCSSHGTFYYRRPDRLETDSPSQTPEAPPSAGLPSANRVSVRAVSVRPPPPPVGPGAAEGVEPRAARSDLSSALDLLAQERYGEALERVGAVEPRAGADAEAGLLRAILLTHAGRFDEAEAECARVLEMDPLNAGAHYALALCRERAGDRQGAIDHDRAAVYLDASFAMPRLHLGILARREGARDLARRELGQALVLLEREDPSRVLLFGGGFRREALSEMCRVELEACGGRA